MINNNQVRVAWLFSPPLTDVLPPAGFRFSKSVLAHCRPVTLSFSDLFASRGSTKFSLLAPTAICRFLSSTRRSLRSAPLVDAAPSGGLCVVTFYQSSLRSFFRGVCTEPTLLPSSRLGLGAFLRVSFRLLTMMALVCRFIVACAVARSGCG